MLSTVSETGSSCKDGCRYVAFAYEKAEHFKELHHKKCVEYDKLTYANTSLREENAQLKKECREYKLKADNYDKIMATLIELESLCEKQQGTIKNQKATIYQLERGEDDFFKWRTDARLQIATLKAENKELTEKNSSLETQVDKLKEENKNCLNEIARLKSILNNNPSNTSTPPSQGQAGQEPHSQRPKSQNEFNDRDKAKKEAGEDAPKRKKGGQKNHKGTTLTKEDVEKFLKNNKDKYIHEIHEFGTKVEGKPYRVKYTIGTKTMVVIKEYRYYDNAEIPVEHYSDVTYDSSLKTLAAYLYGECNMATDKIKTLFSDMSNGMINISEGSAYNFCREFADKAEISIEQLITDLLNGEVLYTDATYTKENGKETYVRNASNEDTVVYSPQDSKTIEDIKATAVLDEFMGIVMSDHETALKHFGAENAECNQHGGRYCTKNTEETGHSWPDDFMSLLYEIKDEKKKLKDAGITAFTDDALKDYFKRYDDILKKGWEQNENDKNLYEYAAKDERALLRRFEKYKDDHLRFATNFKVDFTNNRSESDLRIFKTRTKATGGFRERSGREICCNILSVIRTCKKRKMPIFSTLMTISNTGANVFAKQA